MLGVFKSSQEPIGGLMGRRAPNYRFERQERDRRKAEKKAERLAKKQKANDDSSEDATGNVSAEAAPTEPPQE